MRLGHPGMIPLCCQGGVGARRDGPRLGRRVGSAAGSGVACPKNRPSGCRAGHAGLESSLLPSRARRVSGERRRGVVGRRRR
jgi:hypothetical protein